MTDQFVPTARNSERWQRENEKAQRYLNPAKSLPQAAVDRAQRVRRALAIRHSHRIAMGLRAAQEGTKEQQILHDLMMRLHGVRESENAERLIDRDRVLSGYIAGLIMAEALSGAKATRAIDLRHNDFSMRMREIERRLPID